VTGGQWWSLGSLFLAVVLGLAACARPVVEPPKVPDRLALLPLTFDRVPGWADDRHGAALPALLASCARLKAQPPDSPFTPEARFGRIKDWLALCAEAAAIPPADHARARYFFETRFEPVQALNNDRASGLITGYYEAELNGSWRPDARYRYPLYARPPDLVSVDLGAFRGDWKGQQIYGRLVDGRVLPMPTRRDIEKGALQGRQLELLWVDDPIDAFFLHIQGSGRVRMKDGGTVRLGFAGRNGHPYVAIGRALAERGAIPKDQVSMRSIRTWLAANPHAGQDLMATNDSFVFFRILEGEGPIGAHGVALTPERSLAVDRAFLPLGLPIWLDTTDPLAAGKPLRRLVVAQDTGSAIQGPLRADLFFGFGPRAADLAGAMKQQGQLFLLRPKNRSE
jgi:membrane-bound lytic murein transglycosylase A